MFRLAKPTPGLILLLLVPAFLILSYFNQQATPVPVPAITSSPRTLFALNFPWRSEGYAPPELRRRGDEGRSTASTPRFVSNSHFRVVYPRSLDAE